MNNQLESALVLALRNTLTWESGSHAAPSSGTLTAVDPALPFDCRVYQTRDRQLAYRDLILGAAVVEVAVQVGDVWNFEVAKPTLQGPALADLPFAGTEAGRVDTTVRHVTNVSIPYDAARYADADLYGRDAVLYEVLARACAAAFTDPAITPRDSTGTVIPSTSLWSLAEGQAARADINAALALNRELFKTPDRNLADRDSLLAAYVARLAQQLKNPFEHALRLYTQVESYGTVQREPDVYALVSDDGTHRVFQTEPALPGASQITYSIPARTLQWSRERTDEVHAPQIYAMAVPGIDAGQVVTTLAQVPEAKDAQYWRAKAGLLTPEGLNLSDTGVDLTYTSRDSVSGGLTQADTASFTVPDTMAVTLNGSLGAGYYRVSALARPSSRVEIAGAQNISDTSGTLGGATFETEVASGSIGPKTYLVEGGDGIVYNSGTYLPGAVFTGTNTVATYAQYGALPSTVRQYSVDFLMALPNGAWMAYVEYTNLTGTTDGFRLRADIVQPGHEDQTVMQDVAPIPFTGSNGELFLSPGGALDIRSDAPFTFALRWTGGDGQLHVRRVLFYSGVDTCRYAITSTFAGSQSQVDVVGLDNVPAVLRWQFVASGTQNGTIPLTLQYTADSGLPLRIEQVQVQRLADHFSIPLEREFQGWRQDCLDRAGRIIAQNYNTCVAAYGTDVPVFRDSGSRWSTVASENWMAFVEVYNPRVRAVPAIATDGLAPGRQYEVTVGPVDYDGTSYPVGGKFYCTEDSGTVYSSGTVSQIGAFKKAQPGHLGKPALMPRGLYFDTTEGAAKAYYDTPLSAPVLVACQPWMIEYGLYVAQEEFWQPECLGVSVPAPAVPLPLPLADFVGAPTSGTVPLTVDFTNLTTNPGGATWLWEFGD